VSEGSHARVPPCPRWCAYRDKEGQPDHPRRHESHPLGVEARRIGGDPPHLNATLVKSLRGFDVWIVIGRNDENHVYLSTGLARSFAAALIRLCNVAEGLSA
jgi:hypothetical protein